MPTTDGNRIPKTTLIAIGGGGATHGTHPELDRLCLEYVCKRPRVGFVGAAGGDDPGKFQRFRNGFAGLAGTVSRLSPTADGPETLNWIAGLDLIYFGGGDPVLLVERLQAADMGPALVQAFLRGVPVAGVSAGAMCWFERFVWRSGDAGLQAAPGLGLVPGSMTPHSLVEPDRLMRMQELVESRVIPAGYAVDDGAALVLQDGTPPRSFPAVGPPCVHRITGGGG